MKRSEQKLENTWDLTIMFNSLESWEKEYNEVILEAEKLAKYKSKLSSKDTLLKFLKTVDEVGIRVECLISYAFLTFESDGGAEISQRLYGQAAVLGNKFNQSLSFYEPELLSINRDELTSFLKEDSFKDYKVSIEKTLYAASHTLSDKEERLLALAGKSAATSSNVYHDLCDIDFDFGEINGKKLTHSSYASFMENSDDNIRKEAYEKMYLTYKKYEHAISKLYEGNIEKDIFFSKARGFNSCLEASLFQDNVDISVYKNLIATVNKNLPILHKYYETIARILKKDKLKHYDVYLPLISDVKTDISYDEAIKMIKNAVSILGSEYQETLVNGLTSARWVDRYENEGKRSGAFSAGSYKTMPYILTNYKSDVIRSVFTLIHEGGHSMHSYYSAKNNPFSSYDYTIFEAEVASTFNEQLLNDYLLKTTEDDKIKASLINNQLSNIVATLFRQTMFAEFEMIMHEKVENGEVATFKLLQDTYLELLKKYFGPIMEFEEYSGLEYSRIPHFYRSFYVYKYSTGICASIALSNKVLNGGNKEREDYLNFLKSGGSKFPIDSLRLAGVDMTSKEPIQDAIDYFSNLLDEFNKLV